MYINLLGLPFGMPWVSLGSLWDAIGLHLAVLGPALVPFGVPWGALGLPLGCLGALLGSLWLPLGGLGVPCGCFPQFLATRNLVCHEVTRIATGPAILQLAMGATRGDRSDGNGVKKCSAEPETRAGGQDDGSYTNCLKI